MPVNIQQLFDVQLPAALVRHPDEARAINATYQMNITGSGAWFLDLTSTGPKIEQGNKPADCAVTISSEDFQKLYENPAAGAQLFFAGRLKIAGNPMLGMKLQKLFSLR
jgi:putative sterol carrier protein